MSMLSFFFFKQKTAYEMRISDWSSDVCSSDLGIERGGLAVQRDDAAKLCRRHPALQRRQILHQLVGRLLGRYRQRLRLDRRLGTAQLVGQAAQQRTELVAFQEGAQVIGQDRKSTRLNSSH